jgi:hypothetical protein
LEEDEVNLDLGMSAVTKLSKKMGKGYFSSKSLHNTGITDGEEDTTPMLRKRKLGKRLTIHDKCNIAHAIIVNMEKLSDVAKEHRISRNQVSQVISKCNKSREYLRDMLVSRDVVCAHRDAIAGIVM